MVPVRATAPCMIKVALWNIANQRCAMNTSLPCSSFSTTERHRPCSLWYLAKYNQRLYRSGGPIKLCYRNHPDSSIKHFFIKILICPLANRAFVRFSASNLRSILGSIITARVLQIELKWFYVIPQLLFSKGGNVHRKNSLQYLSYRIVQMCASNLTRGLSCRM